jgi:hypothetical protein
MGSLFTPQLFTPNILTTEDTPIPAVTGTTIEIKYKNGSTWYDLTQYVTNFKIQETGIQSVPNATINIEAPATTLAAYLINPYRLIRIRAYLNNSWQNIFFGYVNDPNTKTIAGTLPERYKLSLDCSNGAARLANDTITMDYYKLQSAMNPYTGAETWTYRKMLNDIFLHPDGVNTTGFTIPDSVPTDTEGIDHYLEKACTWSQQSIFDVVRTVSDRIGYDGYYDLPEETGNWQAILAPFSKASVATFTGPYKGEPEYKPGNINDVANIIYVWGGVDSGIPSDGDRWTEYAITKYASNPIWAANASNGTYTLTDEDNTVFAEQYRANNKCIKATLSNSTSIDIRAILDITRTEWGNIDALNRITQVTFTYKGYATVGGGTSRLRIYLQDASGTRIFSDITYGELEGVFTVNLNTEIYPYIVGPNMQATNTWVWDNGFTTLSTFDWEHIVKLEFSRQVFTGTPTTSWITGFYIDALQFIGGLAIEPYDPTYGVLYPHYGALLNPASYDQTSIDTHGEHILHVKDSSIASFEQAQAEGARVLANLKDPIGTFKFKVIPTTLLKPSNVITVNGSLKRIKSITYDWAKTSKILYAEYNTVSQLAPLPPLWTDGELGYIRYLIK